MKKNLTKICAMYFSGTGTTEKIITTLATSLGKSLDLPVELIDFSLPAAREKEYVFSRYVLLLCGVPTYAGRVPNLLLPFIKNDIKGENTPLIPIVTFGNRNYDDALAELSGTLCQNGFKSIAAAAFSCEHSFSTELGAGRPDGEDLEELESFASGISTKISHILDTQAQSQGQGQSQNTPTLPDFATAFASEFSPISIKGEFPPRPYYTPRDRNSTPINILKVKPKTNDLCINCGLCAKVCTMGSISLDNVREVSGICTKCCACVKKCPVGAKYYDDPGYLYHKTELEEMYSRRASNDIFL